MLSTELEHLCTGFECFLQGGNAFNRVEILLYTVGMLPSGLECFLDGWNAFDRVGITLYRVGMLSTGFECFRQCWYSFVLSWNAF
jgi:hypothetical protein